MSKLNCLLIAVSLLSQSAISLAMDDASADKIMEEQKTKCSSNTSMEWNSTLNRCVGKAAARAQRNEAIECEGITDVAAKEKCHLASVEKTSGLSSDTGSLNQGNTTGSMVLNGAAAAYTAVSMLTENGMKLESSSCTSKNILGVTSVAGFASDIYLKKKAKDKVKDLEGKYQLEKTTSGYQGQVKAFEYLKEEQQTVVDIAKMEKKRNMLLMAGYALAAGFAAYEIIWDKNPDCSKPQEQESGKTPSQTTEVKTVAQTTPPAAAVEGAQSFPVRTPDIKTTPLPALGN